MRNADTANGTQVQIYQDNGTNAQNWLVVNLGEGYYSLSPANAPGKLLQVDGGTTDGTKVDIWSLLGGVNQKWIFVKQ